MKKTAFIVIIIIVMLAISLLTFRETKPSADTRIILEHTHKTYIAPTCFEDSNPTNFLQESTLEEAQSLNYEPHSTCTKEALMGKKDRFLISILKDIGIVNKEWDD